MSLPLRVATGATVAALVATQAAPPVPVLTPQSSGTTALLQAVSVLDDRHAWVSGHAATYAVTDDGGRTWTARTVPGADSLQFRDVHAVSPGTAYLMAAGNGDRSAIYKTTDRGATWLLQFSNPDPHAFYDCMAFWTPNDGFAFSDAVGGHLPFTRTQDGETWTTSSDALPAAVQGEGGFAASGTCAITLGRDHAWIVTGAGVVPRVHRTVDGGRSWSAVELPLIKGGASGAFSVAFRDEQHGVVFGGSNDGKGVGARVVVTTDGGATWQPGGEPPFAASVYGGAYTKVGKRWALVIVGPGGAAYSWDDGATWLPLDAGPYWSLGFTRKGTGWLVGPKGRITKVEWP